MTAIFPDYTPGFSPHEAGVQRSFLNAFCCTYVHPQEYPPSKCQLQECTQFHKSKKRSKGTQRDGEIWKRTCRCGEPKSESESHVLSSVLSSISSPVKQSS